MLDVRRYFSQPEQKAFNLLEDEVAAVKEILAAAKLTLLDSKKEVVTAKNE